MIGKFKKKFSNHHIISGTTIKRMHDKFKETDSVLDNVIVMGFKEMSARTEVNVNNVTKMCEESLSASVRQVAQKVDMSKSTAHRMMRRDVALFSYKIQINQPLTKLDGLRRFKFANKMICKDEKGKMDFYRIWFSNELHFHLPGHVNKHN